MRWRKGKQERFRIRDFWVLCRDGEHLGTVSVGDRRSPFYFYSLGGRNSLFAGERYTTLESAKAACVAYVKGELAAGRY